MTARPETPHSGTSPLAGRNILVVEDQAFIAIELQDYLQKAGAAVTGPTPRLAKGLKAASEERLDAALLDVDVNGERSWPIADVLVQRDIPFAFTTGFEASIVFPERFKQAPVISKPYSEKTILAALKQLLE